MEQVKKPLRVLTIGSSSSVDSNHMINLVAAAEGIGDYEEVVIGTLYYSGCKLSQHVKFLTENSNVYVLYISSTATPVKDGYEFLGRIMPDGSELTMPAYWRYAEDVTVTAKWLKTKEVIEFRIGYKAANKKGTGNLVTDSDDVFDSFLELLSFRVMFLKNETEDNAIVPINMKNLFKMISPV